MGNGFAAMWRSLRILWGEIIVASVGARNKSKSADLRHRITVKKRLTATKDDAGQPVETWTNRFTNEPASFEPVNGGEFLRGRKIAVTTNSIFTVNYRSGYDEKDIIVFDGQEYGIVSIDIPAGIKRYLEIQAKQST